MPVEDSWNSIEKELSQLINNEEYKLVRPLLENIQYIVNAKCYQPEIVKVLLDVVKHLQIDIRKGGNPYELARKISSGFIQPEWNVQGNIYQAEQNSIHQIVIQFFSNNLNELEKIKPKSISIPIVLLVMNVLEAEELASGAIFKDYPDQVHADFEQFQEFLRVRNIVNWVQRYQGSSQEWQPFANSTENIEQMLRRILSIIEGYQNSIEPVFLDIHMLNNNRHALKELRTDGCVVIMDVISMRHPNIQRAFRRSLLDAFPKTMVARIAPIYDALNLKQQMINVIEYYVDLESHKRFKFDLDELCDDEICDPTRFNRWFKNQVKILLPSDAKLQTSSKKYWYQISGVG